MVPVDVWTLRFRREDGRLQAYQLREGEEIKLPMDRFVYVGMDRDGTNPRAFPKRLPAPWRLGPANATRASPFVVKIQQRLFEDMAKATHNAGWAKLHVQ